MMAVESPELTGRLEVTGVQSAGGKIWDRNRSREIISTKYRPFMLWSSQPGRCAT
ncbi:protein of unknown function [Mesotoga infera]|uniref:Uncharacterized protein n=1 Tax=Mesotoga infera TaxID=1236046 RepID=A0A7Z7LF17_9BACT|nr:protein of unknown function [Mesotoga infera]